MNTLIKNSRKFALLAALTLLCSCSSINEYAENCGIDLQFIYDYNMEYTDSFGTHVNNVNVYVFDENGIFLYEERVDCADLEGGNRMRILHHATAGKYKVLCIGDLSEHFCVSDLSGSEPVPGTTRLDNFRIACERASATVEYRFPDMWFGKTVDIDYALKLRTVPVHFVKNTNRFNLMLVRQDVEAETKAEEDRKYSYSFEVVTPEGAVYSWENKPLSNESVTYKPYSLGLAEEEVWAGNINTVRLLESAGDYRLRVRNTATGKQLWDYDLMKLLAYRKPDAKPDGSALGLQEFLDRESAWDITILHKGGGSDEIVDAFVAVAVNINGWIMWLTDYEM